MSVEGGGDWKDAFYAVQKGDIDLVKYHISQGVDLDFQHMEAFSTLLLESISCNQLEIAKVLLESGADPTKPEGYSGLTPLKMAKQMKNQEMIKLLKKYLPKRHFFRLLGG